MKCCKKRSGAVVRWVLLSVLIPLVASPLTFARSGKSRSAKVTYVASEAVYINAGVNQGLSVGDSLVIVKKTDTVAVLLVTHVSQKSAACEALRSARTIVVGDRVSLHGLQPTAGATQQERTYRPASERITSRRRRRKHDEKNALSGSVSFDNLLRQDLTGSGLSSDQFGVRSNITVENIGGTGLRFDMRHRSRLYHRSQSFVAGFDKNEWSHQVFELGVSYGDDSSPVRWGAGRLLAPGVRGMGYLDGAYLLRRVSPTVQFGIAGGLTPDAQTSGVRLKTTKGGMFVTYTNTFSARHKVTLTGSLATEAESFNVSRDFLYLQNSYRYASIVSLTQSMEVEINRGWRHDISGKRFEISNYFGTVNANMGSKASVYVSYDTRKNVRHFDDLNTPDSLFDNSTHRGIRSGFRLRATRNVRLWGNIGVRYREGISGNNTFGSVGTRLNRFPSRGHSLTLSMSYVQTQFTTGYRPNVTYRFPVGRQMRFSVSGSAYLYKTAATTVTNYYFDVGASRPIGQRYFFTGSYRQYIDGNLLSGELYTEIGVQL